MNLAELTDDPDELFLLTAEALSTVEDDDPYSARYARLCNELAALTRQVSRFQRLIPRYVLNGEKANVIAEKLGCSPPTVYAALRNPKVQRILSILEQLNRLQTGPALAARADMLWRIAKRNETVNPRVSIAAVDVLNKQEGVYKPDTAPQTPTVQVVNFNITAEPRPHGERVLPAAPAIEGDFVVVEV